MLRRTRRLAPCCQSCTVHSFTLLDGRLHSQPTVAPADRPVGLLASATQSTVGWTLQSTTHRLVRSCTWTSKATARDYELGNYCRLVSIINSRGNQPSRQCTAHFGHGVFGHMQHLHERGYPANLAIDGLSIESGKTIDWSIVYFVTDAKSSNLFTEQDNQSPVKI